MPEVFKELPGTSWISRNEEELEEFLTTLQVGKARKVKSSTHRLVVEADKFYLKVFCNANPLGKFKLWFHDMARREWENAKKLFDSTRLTAEPVAFGRSRNFSYFVSKSLQPCESLSAFVPGNLNTLSLKQKRALIEAFLEFLEKLRGCGFFQPDFHLDNILIISKNDDGYQFYIIDLHRASFTDAPLVFSKWAEQLTYILPCFDFLPYGDLRRFWVMLKKRYPEMEKYLPYVISRSYSRMRVHWCKREKKIRHGEHRINHEKFEGYLKPDKLPETIKKHLVAEPENLFLFCTNIYKDSRSAKIGSLEYKGNRYIFKRYNRRGFLHSLKYRFRTSRALSHWEKSIKFIYRNLPTPEILAAIEERKRGFLHISYVLSAMVGEGESGFRNHMDYLERNSPEALRHLVLMVWEMHQRGIYHGDAKLSNFIRDPGVHKYGYYVIDLDGSRFKRSVNAFERLCDLADLASSIEFFGIIDNPSGIIFNYYFSLGGESPKYLSLKRKFFYYQVKKKLSHKRRRQLG